MDKVQKYNSFNTNTPSSESYRNFYGLKEFRIETQKWALVNTNEPWGSYRAGNFLISCDYQLLKNSATWT
jgi:hypothetical protein